jgi:hypothetical protein
MARIHAAPTAPAPPTRGTQPYPSWINAFRGGGTQRPIPKPTQANLQRFAEHPLVRAALNVTKNPVAAAAWKIVAAPGLEMTPDMEKRAAIVTVCLSSPNKDDSFRSLAEQVIDDTMTIAGAVEIVVSADPLHPLWLFPVDGSTIRLYPAWTGAPNEARYVQHVGYAGHDIPLRNDQLMYLRMNPRTSTPFGLTPVEVAFNLICAFVSSFDFASKIAGNAAPSFMLDLGASITPDQVDAFRLYWQDSVEGQGETPIIGGSESPAEGAKGAMAQVLKLGAGTDADLRLAWQSWLVRLIALAFGISPQKLNLETSVNRATAEEMAEADDAGAILPMARLLAEYLTREAIGRALGWYDLAFVFEGLTNEDDLAQAQVWEILIGAGITVPDEHRHELGLEPLEGGRGALTATENAILIAKARGDAATVPSANPDENAPQPAAVASPDDKPAKGTPDTPPKGRKPARK